MIDEIKELLSLPRRFIELSRQYKELYQDNKVSIDEFYQEIQDYLYFGGPELIRPVLPKEIHIQLVELVCDAIKHDDFTESRYFFNEGNYFKRLRAPQIGFDFSWNLTEKIPEGIHIYYHYNSVPMDSLNFIFLKDFAKEENFEDLGRVIINSRRTRVRLPDQELDYFLLDKFKDRSVYCAKRMLSDEEEIALRRLNLV